MGNEALTHIIGYFAPILPSLLVHQRSAIAADLLTMLHASPYRTEKPAVGVSTWLRYRSVTTIFRT